MAFHSVCVCVCDGWVVVYVEIKSNKLKFVKAGKVFCCFFVYSTIITITTFNNVQYLQLPVSE